MTGRWAVTLLTALAALIAGISAQSGGSNLASLAWALLAGVALSLMLSGFGLRIVGILLTAVAVLAAGWAVQAGQWIALAGFCVAAVGALGYTWFGPGWRLRPRAERRSQADLWKAMDEGEDPTGEQGAADGDEPR